MSLYTYALPKAVVDRIKSGKLNKDWAVIDVRDDDFIGGHIPGCHHIPSLIFREECMSLIERLKDIPYVIFHCALSQQRGPSAANTYAVMREECLEKGLVKSILPFGTEARCRDQAQQVVVLRGGFTEWVKQFRDDPELVEGYNSAFW
ncbi:hypothetical protein CROQUDRAFT_657808 [Cronartium quercuum f. sp. fusiforme G11]|uniref:Rhodanese domain-containing protein n=1 Tax=Cronartium quercuum f. sp. fusiforme G11 TaxID=708437 RepID=A0A9P6NFY5_9BASI|nr:hypothetical protein CROQUDRAFT_657808 [Cronartium quercuum f. sp. fusiforme G11]